MSRSMASIIAAFLFVFALPAKATDQSDLWWNPDESGWGVNVSQQGRTLFLTFFVYSANGQPLWVVAPAVVFQFTDSTGANIFSGTLYQTSGPWFGGFFNPGAVNVSPVGSVTFSAKTVTTANLTYSISGVSVTKSIVRQTFQANPSVYGDFLGGLVGDTTGCPLASNNGHFEVAFVVSVSGTSPFTQVFLQGSNGSCTVGGPYTQAGRMGRVFGAISCSNGISGNADVFEVEANLSGITGRWQARYVNGCSETAHFSGVRR